MCILNYGATIKRITINSIQGEKINLILGFDNNEDYLEEGCNYLGSLIGRYADRISNGTFQINEVKYYCPKNENNNTLHGGLKGFDKVFWHTEDYANDFLKLSYKSMDGEEGFPGNLTVFVLFKVQSDNSLKIEIKATSDKPTHLNLTNHCYFNLSGNSNCAITNHTLKIYADSFVESNAEFIPTGKLTKVEKSNMDFRTHKLLSAALEEAGNFFDQTWVLTNNYNSPAAILTDLDSGTCMEIYTTEPGLHLLCGKQLAYTLNNQSVRNEFNNYSGLCL